jgi:sulfite reductase (NADPH) flavoprotein alpha-component
LLDFVRDFGSGVKRRKVRIHIPENASPSYSIANSLSAYPDEVHLTIGVSV